MGAGHALRGHMSCFQEEVTVNRTRSRDGEDIALGVDGLGVYFGG